MKQHSRYQLRKTNLIHKSERARVRREGGGGREEGEAHPFIFHVSIYSGSWRRVKQGGREGGRESEVEEVEEEGKMAEGERGGKLMFRGRRGDAGLQTRRAKTTKDWWLVWEQIQIQDPGLDLSPLSTKWCIFSCLSQTHSISISISMLERSARSHRCHGDSNLHHFTWSCHQRPVSLASKLTSRERWDP